MRIVEPDNEKSRKVISPRLKFVCIFSGKTFYPKIC